MQLKETKTKHILICFVFAGIFFTSNYLLLGGYTGGIIYLLATMQTFINYFFDKKEKKIPKWLIVIYFIISFISGIITYKSAIDILPILGGLTYTYSIIQKKERNIRLITFFNVLIWLGYDFYVKAYTTVISDIIFITSTLIGIVRFDIIENKKIRMEKKMEEIYNETKFLMKKYGITANKKLGQNFLIDSNVIDSIADSAELTKEDVVIEIGPGLGTLTAKLLEKAGKVIAIELDERMITILKERFFMYDHFELMNEDVLKVDLKQLIEKNKKEGNIKNVKIVANLPYYITTPIIMKLLEEKLDIKSITVMIQKEVADRLTAIPGNKDSGAITYTVYYYANSKQILTVPKESFIPAPEVESEVIRLDIRQTPVIDVINEKKFFALIKAAFMQRRKTLLNAVSNSGLDVDKEKMENILKELDIDAKVRGEALTIEQFAKIAEKI